MKKLFILTITSATIALSCDKKKDENITSEITTEASQNPETDSTTVNDSATITAQEIKVTPPQNGGNTTQAISVSPTQGATVVNNVQPTGKKPALNPAHGQPFHRCDIAVGAPIDSPAPKTPATQQPQGNSNFNTNPIPAQATAPNTSSSVEKPKFNPPHGEHFHRCDLKVGDPLI